MELIVLDVDLDEYEQVGSADKDPTVVRTTTVNHVERESPEKVVIYTDWGDRSLWIVLDQEVVDLIKKV